MEKRENQDSLFLRMRNRHNLRLKSLVEEGSNEIDTGIKSLNLQSVDRFCDLAKVTAAELVLHQIKYQLGVLNSN